MRRSTTPTLQDVAREAGVHVMAASVVLNGARSSARVSDATRDRILEVAARLRYRPNALARGLQRGRLEMLGVVAIVPGGGIDLYIHAVLNGIIEAAAEHHQSTCIKSMITWQAAEADVLQFCDGRIDGLILLAPRDSTADFAEAVRRRVPFVTIHSNNALPYVYDFEVDDEGGAYAAVRHLISLGHRRIAHFTGDFHWTGSHLRVSGYRRALADAGIPVDESLVIPGPFNVPAGFAAMNRLIERSAIVPLPTAVFCANDSIALGCMEALAQHGIRVPDEISIVGFDDTVTARITIPPLTTMRQPLHVIGRRAVERLLHLVRDEDGSATAPQAGCTEIFPVELVVRASTAPPCRNAAQAHRRGDGHALTH